MDNMKELHEMCETVTRAITQANEKIRGVNGKLSAADAEYVDRLTHILKSVKSVIAMEEAANDMDDGYSERGYSRGYDRSYHGGYDSSYGPGRGRGSNARRDAMGRYSNDGYRGYSRGGDMVGELRELAENAPNEQVKQELMRLADKM